MVDTIHIWRPGKLDKFDLSNVEDLTESVKAFTGETYFTGSLKNLRVSISDRGVSIKGSFPKFLKGNNVETLTAKEFQTVIELLEDVFSVSLSDAIITRLDLAATVEMNYNPAAYYSFLGNCGRMFRSLHGNTLYYSLKCRQLVFYDKAKEAGKEIPNEYRGKNLLRFEVQYRKSISAQFRVQKLRIEQLLRPDFYKTLKNHWMGEFEKIHKVQPIIKAPEQLSTPKEFWTELTKEFIREKGFNKIVNEIEQLKHTGFNPRSVSRMKKQLREMTAGSTSEKSLINELETKIFSY